MLKANAIGCERENRSLFSNLTFELEPGTLLAVTGNNGAGKSSLLRILSGLVWPTSGSVSWQGQVIKPGSSFFSSHLYIGHKIGIQPTLTPLENLQWLLGINDTAKSPLSSSQMRSALNTVGLAGFEDYPCENLSLGQRQRVALARLWLNAPTCWILDEPFTGLDDKGREVLQNRIREHVQIGGIVVLASHVALEDFPCQKQTIHLGSV